MDHFKSNTENIEKRTYNATQDLKEQNRKLMELNERVHGIDENINEAEEYQKGMKNKFWGYIPSLFTGWFKKKKYKDKKIKEEPEEDNYEQKNVKEEDIKQEIDVTKVKSQEDFDELMKRINSMNKAASDLNKEIKISCQLSDNLNNHLDYSKQRVEKCQRNNDIILGKKKK